MLSSDKEKIHYLSEIMSSVSRETAYELLAYEQLVLKWQTHINLVSNATTANLWRRHILDSAQLFPLGGGNKKWLDLGSGGGFPGLVIAICLKATGGMIDLVESNSKKAAFLRTAIAIFDLPARVHCFRIEMMAGKVDIPDIVTARAVTALEPLLGFIMPLIDDKTICLLQKGRDYRMEIEDARQHWAFNLLQYKSKIDKESVILEIKELQKGGIK